MSRSSLSAAAPSVEATVHGAQTKIWRLEASDCGLLKRMPDVRYDPDAQPTEYHGLVLRRYYPINVVFTPPA